MLKEKLIFATVMLWSLSLWAQSTLNGIVKDKDTGQPLARAHVTLSPSMLSTITGSDGTFLFSGVKPGLYTLEVRFLGYKSQTLDWKVPSQEELSVFMSVEQIMQEEFIVTATRIDNSVPAAVQTIDKREITRMNTGRDLPYLLQNTPSLVTSSDAGTGFGYTSFRIRGTDMTRINVMVNGIPLNDPESNQVYWVDLPDISSSTTEIQVNRGVATSVYGNSAFGAGINVTTASPSSVPFAQISSTAGSFGTFRNNVKFGTGLLSGKIAIEGRLSHATSSGYVDRASVKLKSYFLSGGYYGKNTIFKINAFSGYERTYQAWNGTPSDSLESNRTFNPSGLYTGLGGVIKYYSNEVDDYQQDHYQMFFSQALSPSMIFNAALHYTHGFGYYENYKTDRNLLDYGYNHVVIGSDTVKKTDLIQRKHLKNDFAGATASFRFNPIQNLTLNLGSAFNYYEGQHYGTVIWAKVFPAVDPETPWYNGSGKKTEINSFLKTNWQASSTLGLYMDLQFRFVDHSITGISDILKDLTQHHQFNFFNPKAGFSWQWHPNHRIWASIGRANREPSRSDFKDADNGITPKSEMLTDYEVGYNYQSQLFTASANGFFMDYADQLVLTGKINNVGDAIMVNVPESYRAGIEVMAEIKPYKNLLIRGNATLSTNKIRNFVAYVDDWNTYSQRIDSLGNTELSFSPPVTAGGMISYEPVDGLTTSINYRFVGKQYIDNTSNDSRSLDEYSVTDLLVSYSFKTRWINTVKLWVQVNNVFDAEYVTNAWVYRYYYENQEHKLDGYFPQAGIHFLTGITLDI